MLKSELIKELGRIAGDPEIAVKVIRSRASRLDAEFEGEIDRINEFPSPEIIIVEK